MCKRIYVSLKLDENLLKEVSRSFYLTLRLLPPGTREVISLGYFLARASDTIADSVALPIEMRTQHLTEFMKAVSVGECVGFRDSYDGLKHAGEVRLMQALNTILEVVPTLEVDEQMAIKKVVKVITEGQLWDLTYFSDSCTQVESDEQLDHYTYQVAGCVGEFWTTVLAMNGYISERDSAEMNEAGVRYGKGLQLTIILFVSEGPHVKNKKPPPGSES